MSTNNKLQRVLFRGILTGKSTVEESTEDDISIGFTLATKNKNTGRYDVHNLTAFDDNARVINSLSRGDWVHIESSLSWLDPYTNDDNERCLRLTVYNVEHIKERHLKFFLHEAYIEGYLLEEPYVIESDGVARFVLTATHGRSSNQGTHDHSVVITQYTDSINNLMSKGSPIRACGQVLWIDPRGINDEYQSGRRGVVLAQSITPALHLDLQPPDANYINNNILRLVEAYDSKDELQADLQHIALENHAHKITKALQSL